MAIYSAWLVDSLIIDTDECILWPFHVSSNGRAMVHIFNTTMSASRAALILRDGEDHDGLDVLNACDQGKLCVNSNHLRWGTTNENMTEKRAAHTRRRKFTDDEIRQIMLLAEQGVKRANIARAFGCSYPAVTNLLKRNGVESRAYNREFL